MNALATSESVTPAIASTCIVGLGGLFGDDRVGWDVVKRIKTLIPVGNGFPIRLATGRSPADLLELLGDLRRLIVIDACQGLGIPGTVLCLPWPTPAIEKTRHGCGHNLSLDQVLEIAARLKTLPDVCELWCIEGSLFEFEQPLSPEVELAVARVASEIVESLQLN
jgi:hydrogenase maturation protease